MNNTLFFVLGPSLVAVALIVSFIGLRFDKFPASKALMIGATVAIVALVGATMTFAWRNAADEQGKRQAALAADTAANAASGNTAAADEEAGSSAPAATSTTTTASVDGKQVFATAGCTGCHTLADAGSTATTGPDLDGALKNKLPEFIQQSIEDPNAFVEKGYPPNVMPQDYKDQLSPEEIQAVVKYLSETTSGQS